MKTALLDKNTGEITTMNSEVTGLPKEDDNLSQFYGEIAIHPIVDGKTNGNMHGNNVNYFMQLE